MDLSTAYLGLPLAHPCIVGASPPTRSLDSVKRLEDGGAGADPAFFEPGQYIRTLHSEPLVSGKV